MIVFLVAPTDERGIADAQERGWSRIARARFVSAERHDVRVIRWLADLMPMPAVTAMIKGAGYDEAADERWIKERDGFDAFVESGKGEWVQIA